MTQIPNLLIVAGTGNKSGKTTFACRVIEQFRESVIVGIKITPHFHETTPGLNLVVSRPGYSIYEETDPGTPKDTSRMLKAGADHVFFAKVNDASLKEAFLELMNHVPKGVPVVCESPALRLCIAPGLFVIMKSDSTDNNKNINYLLRFPHVMIHITDLNKMDTPPVEFNTGKWTIKPVAGIR